MYTITKSVIESKNYDLSDMLKKLDTLWVQGSISDAEREELIALARKNAEVQNSIDIMAMIDDLEERVRILETKVNTGSTGNTGSTNSNVAEYKPNKKYKNGDKVLFEGKVYICIVPDKEKCVWSPADYPEYWEEVGQPL